MSARPARPRRPRRHSGRRWPRLPLPALPRLRLDAALRLLDRHLLTARDSAERLARTPGASLMTAAVIGIALALPSGLYVLLDNVQRVLSGWDGAARASVFLDLEVTEKAAQALAARLGARPDVDAVELIPREQALAELEALPGFGEALDLLDENPLPVLLVVTPKLTAASGLDALMADLEALPEADLVQLDRLWLMRLFALAEVGRRGVLMVGALLAVAVLLIVGNTVRLEVQGRREEIEVVRLVGGTDAFVRRPFLYAGLCYGLAGGVVAWLLVSATLWLLGGPVSRLAGLYRSDFALSGLAFPETLALLGLGLGLGWLGAWIAVGRHLEVAEPG